MMPRKGKYGYFMFALYFSKRAAALGSVVSSRAFWHRKWLLLLWTLGWWFHHWETLNDNSLDCCACSSSVGSNKMVLLRDSWSIWVGNSLIFLMMNKAKRQDWESNLLVCNFLQICLKLPWTDTQSLFLLLQRKHYRCQIAVCILYYYKVHDSKWNINLFFFCPGPMWWATKIII